MLRIDLRRDVRKFVAALPPKHARQVARKILGLAENPEPHDSIVLKGKSAAFRRADVGEYRIVYRVEGETLKVVLVGKRNDSEIYRRLKRLL